MRPRALAPLLAVCLAFIAAAGCATSPAEREAAQKAWAERDAQRAAECARNRGRFVAGACIYGGGA
jgi:hypothetical protein